MKTVVIGGGVGGLCTAIRLRAAGHEVTLVERNPIVGGKLAALTEEGYTFDLARRCSPSRTSTTTCSARPEPRSPNSSI